MQLEETYLYNHGCVFYDFQCRKHLQTFLYATGITQPFFDEYSRGNVSNASSVRGNSREGTEVHR